MAVQIETMFAVSELLHLMQNSYANGARKGRAAADLAPVLQVRKRMLLPERWQSEVEWLNPDGISGTKRLVEHPV